MHKAGMYVNTFGHDQDENLSSILMSWENQTQVCKISEEPTPADIALTENTTFTELNTVTESALLHAVDDPGPTCQGSLFLPTILTDEYPDTSPNSPESVLSPDCYSRDEITCTPSPRGPPGDLKVSLRNKIQSRRISEGKDVLVVLQSPERKYELTEEEKRRSEDRRQRNRASANKSRLKRKQQQINLTRTVEELETQNGKLATDVAALRQLKRTLETLFQGHLARCQGGNRLRRRTTKEQEIARLEAYLKG